MLQASPITRVPYAHLLHSILMTQSSDRITQLEEFREQGQAPTSEITPNIPSSRPPQHFFSLMAKAGLRPQRHILRSYWEAPDKSPRQVTTQVPEQHPPSCALVPSSWSPLPFLTSL